MTDAMTLPVAQVLQNLRKRLSAKEVQAKQRQVVEGMVAASK